MKFVSTLAVAAGLVASANAHTRVFGVWVNDVFQGTPQNGGQSVYIRSPPSNSPVKDVSSPVIACNVNNVAVPQKVDIKAGDQVTFEWFHNTRGDDIIDPSHKGPITVYIAPLASNGNGAVWTKIAETGLVNGVWATDALIANKGKHSVVIPSSLKAGEYLLRAEIIALHEADTNFVTNNARGAQFYPSCSQFSVAGDGNAVPDQNFDFVGGYTPTGTGILFNIYSNPSSYPIPGPPVWVPSSAAAPAPVAPKPHPVAPKPTTMATVTRKPTQATPKPKSTPAPKPVSSAIEKYYQCGGVNFKVAGSCVAGTTCKYQNPYYSQCL